MLTSDGGGPPMCGLSGRATLVEVDGQLTLRRGSRPMHTVFDLLGQMENDLTYSLGWAFARCPTYLAALTSNVTRNDPGTALSIDLQEAVSGAGFTDIEIRYERAHVIIEAKRGWALPTMEQLAKYRPRVGNEIHGALVALSEASREYARRRLPTEVDGLPVGYLPWSEVIDLALDSATRTKIHEERQLLRELARYLRGAVREQNFWTTWTYCVAVSNETPEGFPFSFRKVVTAQGRYFHPYGVAGWPKAAPNFLAFRWSNAVQAIHHVDGYQVAPTLQDAFPGIPENEVTVRPHALYTLGPKIGPSAPLPSGTSYRASRLWVALDLLLTAATLKEALAQTKQRQAVTGTEPGV